MRRDREGFLIRTCNHCRWSNWKTGASDAQVVAKKESARLKIKSLNDETREAAHRSGLQWTGIELELASRDDLTVAAVASMTGRSYEAVVHARRKVRVDPKWAQVAGVGEVAR